MSEKSGEGLNIGTQSMDRSMLPFLPLEDLHRIYTTQTKVIEDVRDAGGVGNEVHAIVAEAAELAREELRTVGVDVEPYEAIYSPEIDGAKPVEGRSDAIKVGQPGRCDRPYYLVTELSHEMLHQYIEHELGIENDEPAELAREEGLCQVWNLYRDDLLTLDEDDGRVTAVYDDYADGAIDARLDDMRQVYNKHMMDGYGDQIHWYAERFVDMFYNELEGNEEERMEQLLDYGFDVV